MLIDDLPKMLVQSTGQERRPIRLVASDGLTNIYNGGSHQMWYKTAQITKTNSFSDKNEIEAAVLSSPNK